MVSGHERDGVLRMPITFENPPVDEVVVGTYFKPPLRGLRNEHIGLFWKKIKDEFPVVQQHRPIEHHPIGLTQLPIMIEPVAGNVEMFPVPRYWFVGSNDINLVQIQKNAFIFNWRRRDKAYPGFHEHIKPSFDKWYDVFREFIQTDVGATEPRIDLCELTYINIVEKCEFWTGPRDTRKVIPSFSMPTLDTNAPEPTSFQCAYFYRVEEDLELLVVIRNGAKTKQPNTPVLIFEIKAGTRLGQAAKSMADKWFGRAHDAIIECFLGLTSKEVRNGLWKQREDAS